MGFIIHLVKLTIAVQTSGALNVFYISAWFGRAHRMFEESPHLHVRQSAVLKVQPARKCFLFVGGPLRCCFHNPETSNHNNPLSPQRLGSSSTQRLPGVHSRSCRHTPAALPPDVKLREATHVVSLVHFMTRTCLRSLPPKKNNSQKPFKKGFKRKSPERQTF